MEICAIIQARMGSTRLPGKVLKTLCGKSVLENIIDNLLKSKYVKNVIVATTDTSQDDSIEIEISKTKATIFRGNELDVLDRYYNASKINKVKNIIRITGDNPIIDYRLLDECIEKFYSNKIDYLRTEKFPLGMGFEIFTFEALEKAYFNAKKGYEREHVTPHLYDLNNKFKIFLYKNKNDYSKYRVTLDTQEDFQVIKAIYEDLFNKKGYFLLTDVVEFLDKNQHIAKINEKIYQKKLGE